MPQTPLPEAAAPEHLEYLVVQPDTVIFQEGEHGYCAYVLQRGRVEVSVDRGGRPLILAVRGPGEIFGEMAIIDNQPRTATVRALEECELLLVTREQLIRRMADADPLVRMCVTLLLDRFRDTLRKLQSIDGAVPVAGPGVVRARGPEMFAPADAPRYDRAIREIQLEGELEAALGREDFELHFQPIVDLRSGSLAGFEALVRWRHADRGLISPNVFIPTAEASGLIVPLGRWCFRQGCTTLKEFDAARAASNPDMPGLFVSVNVSARDFADPDFVQHVDATIDETGVDAERMKLEITESMLMQRPEQAVEALDHCKVKGLSIAIDDFGTGYSSLSYLHKFPIDTLKIDRSFVGSMHDNRQSMEIVRSILGLAHQLGIPAVAEGIETPRDAAALQAIDCDYGQGYYFSKPLPAAEAIELIGRWTPADWTAKANRRRA